LLTFARPPEWVDRNWIRLSMLAGAAAIPLVIGVLSLKLLDPVDAPRSGGERLKAVLRGYPYTLGLAVTLILLTVFAPILHLRAMARRWTTQHVPVIVEPQDYLAVVNEMDKALANAGWKATRRPVSWMLSLPTRILTALAGGAVKHLVADQLTTLEG